MKPIRFYFLGIASVTLLAIAACSSSEAPKSGAGAAPADGAAADSAADSATAGLAKLSSEDRALAEKQRWCVVEQENLLGSMEAPVKLMIDGKPVFLCCKGCESAAKKDEKATLKRAKALIEINEALAKLSPDDRAAAEKQHFCAVNTENRLGSMGPPVKLSLDGGTVFLCCSGCEQDAKAKPAETLAAAEKLKKMSPTQ